MRNGPHREVGAVEWAESPAEVGRGSLTDGLVG